MSRVRVPMISDTGSACLADALQWLVGMQPVPCPEEQWTEDRVIEEVVTTKSSVVALVMHTDDYRNGVIHCGPQVTTALLTCARTRKDYVFLVPMTVESQLSKDAVKLVFPGGITCPQPRGLFTSDIRIVCALVSRGMEVVP